MSLPLIQQAIPTFKVVLVGDAYVGKTTYVLRMLNGEFQKHYVATLGVDVHPLRFPVQTCPPYPTSVSGICFNIWDTAGQEQYGGLRDGYYLQAQAAIVMVDNTKSPKERNDSAKRWIRDILRVAPGIPIYIAHNKCDIVSAYPQVEEEVDENRAIGLLSVLSCYHHEAPFLFLARYLLGEPYLRFSESPNLAKPENHLSIAKLREYEDKLSNTSIS